MVTLLTALVSLVDVWKQHVGSGVPITQVMGKIDSASASEMLELTSDSATRGIVSAIESSLAARSRAAIEAAEDLAEQYGTKKSLLAETTLEEFLSEIWPRPAQVRMDHSTRRCRLNCTTEGMYP
jgi:hypothetical protein